MLQLAEMWTDWIAYPMMAAALLTTVALAVGYLVKVVSTKYPRQ